MEDSLPSDKLLRENEADEVSFFSPEDDSQSKRRRRWLQPSFLALVTSILLNVVLLINFTVVPQDFDRSPVLDSIRIPYKTVLFNVTLFSKSIYREDASEDVDQAWVDLGLYTTQIVREEDAAQVGFSPGFVKRRASDGGGFIAQMEVFHQLHCLDTLRQGLYFNYEYYHTNRHGVWGRSDAVVRKHMGHCLDLLRVQLQCTADIGLLGMVWVNATGTPEEFANFKTEHQCRDFEKIRMWALANDEKGTVEWREGDEVLEKFP